jgi:diketogulonate reductase-like aldo/keto reductase
MQLRTFGATDRLVPRIGQGTWNLERTERSTAIAALQRGLEVGMSHIDTAEMYGSGRVEEIVGEAIAGRRDDVFLVSKVLPQNASRHGTIAACEASLRRLRTDVLDVYLLHWPGEHPLRETIDAFEELVANEKIRAWGVSNFDEAELKEALALSGPGRVACNQVLYHLEERSIEHAVLPFCAQHDIALVGYSPFGSGSFPSERSEGGRVLAEIARERGATARQVALGFLTQAPGSFAIPKAASVAHVDENAGAGDLDLSVGEVSRIDIAIPRGRRRRGVPML